MQDESGVAADEARGINPQREVRRDAGLAIAIDRKLRVALDPGRFHMSAPALALVAQEAFCPPATLGLAAIVASRRRDHRSRRRNIRRRWRRGASSADRRGFA